MEDQCLCTSVVARECKAPFKVELLFSSVLFSISNAAHSLEHWQQPPQRVFLYPRSLTGLLHGLLHAKMNCRLSHYTYGDIHFESRSSQESIRACFQSLPLAKNTEVRLYSNITYTYKIPTLESDFVSSSSRK